MNKSYNCQQPSPSKPLTRQNFLPLLSTSLQIREYNYAQQIALGWLSFYPGDLEASLLYGQSLFGKGNLEGARKVFEKVLVRDPEFLEAHHWMRRVKLVLETPDIELSESAIYILSGKQSGKYQPSEATRSLRYSYKWLNNQSRPLATWEKPLLNSSSKEANGQFLPSYILEKTNSPLASVIHLRTHQLQGSDSIEFTQLVEQYHNRWTDCILIKIILAQALMQNDSSQAVKLLHEAVVLDTTAQTIKRIWDTSHPYYHLWPKSLEIAGDHVTAPQAIPIPAKLMAAMGWNQLPGHVFYEADLVGKELDNEYPQVARKVAPSQRALPKSKRKQTKTYPGLSELKQIASKMHQPGLGRVDGRFPVYVVLTSQQGLVEQYGKEQADHILMELSKLVQTVNRYQNWNSLLYLADKPEESNIGRKFCLEPINTNDPWKLKLALVDLDDALGKMGQMIGAILIVGGPEIIPFHHLPNPVDDTDPDVPSDNPYSSRDENYFIPEWSVGRLPGGASDNSSMLVSTISKITAYHDRSSAKRSASRRFWHQIWHKISRWLEQLGKQEYSFGYSAAVWQQTSSFVYRPIGRPENILISPPTQVSETCAINKPDKVCLNLPDGKLAYFNLHGLPDTDEWFGQRDPQDVADGPDFPLALRASDISYNGSSPLHIKAPEVVFSEACYGAHIIEKTIDQAISLKFLASGSGAVVGSTCISYGSIDTPLIGADLLGQVFWKYLKGGQPAGEALRRSKIHLAREMHQRQGFLDGEDQKTLLSFILYGDPLFQVDNNNRYSPKKTMRPNKIPAQVKTVCDRKVLDNKSHPIPEDTLNQVKQYVSTYLPGMQNATIAISQVRSDCQGKDHSCPSSQFDHKAKITQGISQRNVVTLSKTILEDSIEHIVYARMAIDQSGKVVKLTVSR